MTLFENRYRVESARLARWDYASRGWYFATLCTKNKECSLGRAVDGQIVLSDAGGVAESEIKGIPTHYENVIIDCYVVMPNHVHALVVIDGDHVSLLADGFLGQSPKCASGETGRAPSLQQIVGSYKAGVSRICHARGLSGFAWQARFHDHILRSNASVNAARRYRRPEREWLASGSDDTGRSPAGDAGGSSVCTV